MPLFCNFDEPEIPGFEIINETKRQVKFIDLIQKCERQRHDAVERDRLMKAAKSRSKLDDPESEKLKQQAKKLEKQEIEERRQQEANETALAAIGRKRKRTDGSATVENIFPNSASTANKPSLAKRNVRVSINDICRSLEHFEFPKKAVVMMFANDGMFTKQ
ncbi:hypothetical protein GJ496_004302 [Pomphorhynchus laevis]|nr:hypothetical protein GJ496_004302 [Pomphorhynchus laevis]